MFNMWIHALMIDDHSEFKMVTKFSLNVTFAIDECQVFSAHKSAITVQSVWERKKGEKSRLRL